MRASLSGENSGNEKKKRVSVDGVSFWGRGDLNKKGSGGEWDFE
ncbi:MAG: hypothetical protein Devi2KO_40080 [Devosia indica]